MANKESPSEQMVQEFRSALIEILVEIRVRIAALEDATRNVTSLDEVKWRKHFDRAARGRAKYRGYYASHLPSVH